MNDATLQQAIGGRRELAERFFDSMHAASFDGVGITRASYGTGEQAAHDILAGLAQELGLEVTQDAALNTYATLPGRDRSAPPVMIGSHLDSVPQGGNFDGAAGVVSGLTVMAALKDLGAALDRDVTVMGVRAEESAWFGVSYIGSRAALGRLPDDALETARRADDGISLGEHIAALGGDPERLLDEPPHLDPARLRAWVEPHIEQGPVLVQAGKPVGIVTGIRGNRRLPAARCHGSYAHCGGEPRWNRRDAVLAVSELMMTLDALWDEIEARGGDFAFTPGMMFTDASRHAMTIVAGEVGFSLDLRSLHPDTLTLIEERLPALADEIAAHRQVRFELGRMTSAAPGVMSEDLLGRLHRGVAALGLDTMDLPSGAAHDAAAFAAAGTPTAMIFIRNENGSHNPDEAMEVDDFMAATALTGYLVADIATA